MQSSVLSHTHPELVSQAVGWDPACMSTFSNRKVRWRCPDGHEWDATVFSRTRSPGTGCPVCSNRKVLKGVNDLATTHPDLAAQAFGWDPTTVVAGSSRKMKWRCDAGHVWEASPARRVLGGRCLICLNRVVLPGFNDLATTHPDLASQAVGWDPTTVVAGNKTRRAWQCPRGHTWEAPTSERARRDAGCPACAGRAPRGKHASLAVEHPDIAAEAAGWDPSSITAGSSAILLWRCGLGHEWRARVSHRVDSHGCPTCSGSRILAGFNDLATTHPGLAEQAVGWDPTTVGYRSAKSRRWRCEKGHRWDTRVDVRANGSGCPYCSGRKPTPGFNDLATTHPDLAQQADGWDPRDVATNDTKRRWWRCSLGHRWKAYVFSRTRAGNGCPVCSGRQLLTGFNDLLTTHPDVAQEADGWDPGTVLTGSKTMRAWKCPKGHRWVATVASRTRKKPAGCPTCADYGFSSDKPAYVYLVEHSKWGLLKIGISNVPQVRVGLHQSRGWRLLDQIGPMPGWQARECERRVLQAVWAAGAIRPGEDLGRFDGYTETWIATTMPATSIAQLDDRPHAPAGYRTILATETVPSPP